MHSPEMGPSPEELGINKKGPELVEGETYDVAGPKRALENPKLVEKIVKGARGRANDIVESGQLKERIGEGETVLYVGTGTGHVAQLIEKQTGAKVIKFDLADLRTDDTKDEKFALANARRLPIRDSSVDTICLFDILHHTQNQDEILKEALRALKPGGKCLILEDTIMNPDRKLAGAQKWLTEKADDAFNMQPKGVNPHNNHTIEDWGEIFRELGFAIDEDETAKWYWGPADFLGAKRDSRPDHNTIARPFESTLFEIKKPITLENEVKE